ncbi:MAG: non-canonical purine NTP pyrophosphatase, RdgB/HAM1 family [Chloroflexi bacterium RBG_19FT_COMBO_56_12]|nr:MAG: non-canonical purine NTP pyrophosphatase, RdgB/HAM1 family [Chloroflexi bacterium RBG_19FT_COMBO_56_12]
MPRILIATGNKGKLHEIQALLRDPELILLLPAELGIQLEVEENGTTYETNAAIKAMAFACASGLLTLADDSGLEVDALGGLPGVRSARFSPLPNASDADRRRYLLERLGNAERPWTAHFHCTVALALPDGRLRFASGECRGEVIPEERGQNGFGYDPIFLFPELGRTMAELSMEEKNSLSHRARAVQAARPMLIEMLAG